MANQWWQALAIVLGSTIAAPAAALAAEEDAGRPNCSGLLPDPEER